MSSLKVVGRPATASSHVVTKLTVDTALEGGVSQAYLQQAVQDGIAPLATKAYVDQQDGQFATKSYVNAQDALYLPNTQRAAANGVAPLDSSGKVPLNHYPLQGQGTWKGPYYPTSRTTATDVQQGQYKEIARWSYPAPGFRWVPLVFANVIVANGAGRGDVEVRVGLNSPGNLMISSGRGPNFFNGYATVSVVPVGWNNPGSAGYDPTAVVNLTMFLTNPFAGATASDPPGYEQDSVLYLVKVNTT